MRTLRTLFILTFVAAAFAVRAQTPRDSLLVSREWLSAHLRDPNLVLLHIGPRPAYDSAHVAGSQFVEPNMLDAHTDLALELPGADSLKKFLEQHGISDNSRIVVIPGSGWFSPATRLILTLDHAGFGSRTSMLDGGLTYWRKGGLPVTADLPTVTPGRISALRLKTVTVSAEAVRDRKPETALIDARAVAFYDGASAGGNEKVQVKGHIPGAKSLFYLSVLDSTATLLPPQALKDKFIAAGWQPGKNVIAYCHVGQQATLVVFAARTLGIDVKLFDGSFEDWAVRGWPTELPPGK
ncbi:MAG TPA: rhodanese-like domain-containing protein [Gemmatimonadaceae bacterium]|nr:rhodanese-like domain-containing protein [Gemmatimonadaceae bacterium]